MKISSNSLFHFTSQIEFLEDILKNGFWPRYCREYGWGNKFIDFAVPMVCFCDIPLSMIEEHTKFYGNYGIGVSKKWISEHKTITPVQYVAAKSHEFDCINRLLTLLKNGNIDERGINKLLLAKKVSGEAINKNNDKKPKKFYDEREWRHVPDTLAQKDIIIPVDKKENFDSNKESEKTNGLRLTIDIDSIQYIIIPNEQKRHDMIDVINKTFQLNHLEERLVLMSKILTINQILNDF